ncbi:MAG: hypothetical protein K9J30_02970 [Bacteroidales bacterium]|nr:hypothetical protein [Bacteroidales bacterium]
MTTKQRFTAIFFTLLISIPASCDVLFSPYDSSKFTHSVELIVSHEIAISRRWSTVLRAGVGAAGSFEFLEMPVAGMELAAEERFYFKNNTLQGAFISGYIGAAFMTNLSEIYDVGVVSGINLGFKNQYARDRVFEPFIGISVPVGYSFKNSEIYIPIPVFTIGLRFGIYNTLRNSYYSSW